MGFVNALVTPSQPVQKTAPVMPAAAPAAGPGGQAPADALAAATVPAVDADQLNTLLQQHQQHLAFSVDEASGRSVIKVIDTRSGDVIRQMPSESWLKLAQELARQAGGLLRTQA